MNVTFDGSIWDITGTILAFITFAIMLGEKLSKKGITIDIDTVAYWLSPIAGCLMMGVTIYYYLHSWFDKLSFTHKVASFTMVLLLFVTIAKLYPDHWDEYELRINLHNALIGMLSTSAGYIVFMTISQHF